jgi:urease accessory protein
MSRIGLARIIISAAVLGLSATAASAHVGHSAEGFVHGFLHPVGGVDHLLATLASGLLGALIGGKARWLVPLTFITAMVSGGALGASGVELPLVESMILASVIVLGALAAFGTALRLSVILPIIAAFALFHGFAHGAEMPANVSGSAYAAGFVAATALLHAVAVAAFIASAHLWSSRHFARIAGAGVALAGAGLALRLT